MIAWLDRLLADQGRAADPTDHDMPGVLAAAQSWVEEPATPEDARWWLRGLALLADPVLPDFGTGLWQALGLAATPTIAAFAEPADRPLASGPPIPGETRCVRP